MVSAFFQPMKGRSESMAHRMGRVPRGHQRGERRPPGPDECPVRFARGNAAQGRHFRVARSRGDGAGHARAGLRRFRHPAAPRGAHPHVIHYDLAWNPAVVEQRAGRVDRIGNSRSSVFTPRCSRCSRGARSARTMTMRRGGTTGTLRRGRRKAAGSRHCLRAWWRSSGSGCTSGRTPPPGRPELLRQWANARLPEER